MTTKNKVARRKLSLLELAAELNNVSRACKVMGYSRQQFYEIRRNYQTYGAEGLLDRLPGPKGPHPNRVGEEVEKAILDYSLNQPTHGPLRVAQQLVLQNVQVSAGGSRPRGASGGATISLRSTSNTRRRTSSTCTSPRTVSRCPRASPRS